MRFSVSIRGKPHWETSRAKFSDEPTIGRFISPDPLDASPSTYVFALDNPIMYVDPSGLIDVPAGNTEEYGNSVPLVHQMNRGYRLLVNKAMRTANDVFHAMRRRKRASQERQANLAMKAAIMAKMRAVSYDARNPPAYTNQYSYKGKRYSDGEIIPNVETSTTREIDHQYGT